MRLKNDTMKKNMRNVVIALTLGMTALTISTAQAGIPEEYGLPTRDGGYLVTYLVTGQNYTGDRPIINVINVVYKDNKVYCDLFRGFDYSDPDNVEGQVMDEDGGFYLDNGHLLYHYSTFHPGYSERYDARLYALGVDPGTEQKWFFVDGVDRISFKADENGILRPEYLINDRKDNCQYGIGWMITDYDMYDYHCDPPKTETRKFGKQWDFYSDIKLTPVSPGYWVTQSGYYNDYCKGIKGTLNFYKFNKYVGNMFEKSIIRSQIWIDTERDLCYWGLSNYDRPELIGFIKGDKVIFPDHQIWTTTDPNRYDANYRKYEKMPLYMVTVDAEIKQEEDSDASIHYTPHNGDLIFDFDGKNLTNPSCSVTQEKEISGDTRIYILPEFLSEDSNGIDEITEMQDQSSPILYDLTGRVVKTANPAPGIYIRNGRKILVK